MKFTVESIEDGVARLECDGTASEYIQISLLPECVREGDVLTFDGEKYNLDVNATAKRRQAVCDKFSRLFRK